MVGDRAALLAAADIVLTARAAAEDIPSLKAGAVLIGILDPHRNNTLAELASRQISAFTMELLPRTTRAQSMDVLSSQNNIAGYRAVLLATQFYPRFMPMLMTAAGTVKAAKVLVLGAGVAGLQAIATAKRLGRRGEAFDVRPAARSKSSRWAASLLKCR